MKFLSISFVTLAALMLVVPLSLLAQGTQVAQIVGRVTDATGGAVPGATIRATQTNTDITRTVSSGADGSFTITNLPVGPYRLEAESLGFSTYVREGIVLQVNSSATINPVLEVGAVAQQIVVEANAAMVETRVSSYGQLIDQERVVELPLNGRNVTQLVALSGGATDVTESSGLKSNKNYPSASAFSVAGGQGGQTLFLLDGLLNMDALTNVGLPMPMPDALQEFKVETGALPANYGVAPGGVVNVVTKSGGNEFHGDAFWFVRNYHFNARNFFAPERDSLKRNQFGGVITGPIDRRKLFFLFGTQWTYESVAPSANISYIPTQAVLNGDFSEIMSPACNQGRVLSPLKAPFENNKINPALYNPIAMKFVTGYLPVSPDPCGKITYEIPSETDEQQFVTKVDWQANDKHAVFVRYFFTDWDHPPFYEGNLLTMSRQDNAGLADRVQSLVLGHTFTITPTTISVFRAGFMRSAVIRHNPEGVPTPQQLGSNVFSPVPNWMNFNVSNYFNLVTSNSNPGPWIVNSYNLSEELSLLRGNHQIAVGTNIIHTQLNARGSYQNNGNFSFRGQLVGNALADFMTGKAAFFLQSAGQVGVERVNIPSVYVNDTIRVNPHLTMTLGIRWDPYLAPYTAQEQINYFDMDWYKQDVRSTVFTNAPAGSLFPGDPAAPTGGSYFFDSWGKFAPRIGIVYDPRGQGLETIRAGYGIFYGGNALWVGDAGRQPFQYGQALPNPPGGLSDPYLGQPGGNPFPLPSTLPKDVAFPLFGINRGLMFNLDFQAPYIQQWNLAIQKQLPNDWMISATYLGNRSLHLLYPQVMNPAVYIPGNCEAGEYGLRSDGACSNTGNTNYRRLLYIEDAEKATYYSGLGLHWDGANANYNGLVLAAQHRFVNNYSLMANYTWSKCLGEVEMQQGGGTSPQDVFNRHGEYGNCATSRRHMFNLSSVLRSPDFSTPWAQKLLGNWQASTIFTARTGTFNTVTLGIDNALQDGSDRPNLVRDPNLDNPTIDRWFDINAFERPAVGQNGTAGRGIVVGPGAWNVDIAVSRLFPITEVQQVNFRAEIFNLFNHTRFDNPNTNWNSGQFGTINSAQDPRIMQFAVKYIF